MIKEGPPTFVLVLGIYVRKAIYTAIVNTKKNMEFYLGIVVSVLTLCVDPKKFISVE